MVRKLLYKSPVIVGAIIGGVVASIVLVLILVAVHRLDMQSYEIKKVNTRITNYLDKANPASSERFYILCKNLEKLKRSVKKTEEQTFHQDLHLRNDGKIKLSGFEVKIYTHQYKHLLKDLQPLSCSYLKSIVPPPPGKHI